jgi:hypothetical protein
VPLLFFTLPYFLFIAFTTFRPSKSAQHIKPGVVVQIYNPSTWEAEAGEEFEARLDYTVKFKASLGYIVRLVSKIHHIICLCFIAQCPHSPSRTGHGVLNKHY